MYKVPLSVRRTYGLYITAILLVIGMALASCSGTETDSTLGLDRNQIATESTDAESRREYYHKHVEKYMDTLTEEEKDAYRVKLHVEYVGADEYPGDDLIFLRNDNTYKGDISNYSDIMEVSPGIYTVISHEVGDLGEIELLNPYEEHILVVNYETKTATIRTNAES